jgi:peroxiredoxin
MKKVQILIALGGIVVVAVAVAPPTCAAGADYANVAELQNAHDRALIRDLQAYIAAKPKAEDIDHAYMTLFDKTIEHDWFLENEEPARRYLAAFPDGAVQSLAQIVATMARAQAGQFGEALKQFQGLMAGLGKPEQEEFAAHFTDSLAQAATTAGAFDVARQAYEALLQRYGESQTVRQKVKVDLNRLSLVGKPAPSVVVKDLKGDSFRLDDLRGRYVLVDFWATWCAPCVAELPRVQEAYAKYHEKGFEVVGVSLDETKPAVVDFIRTRNLPWRQIHNASCDGDLVEAFGVSTIPATFLIDPRGTIIRLELNGPALDQTLAQLLKDVASLPKTGTRR